MESLRLDSTNDTPEVIFDVSQNIFSFSGRSLPENAIGFFEPILKWIYEYLKNPLSTTVFNVSLEYFNTASAKQLAKVFKSLEKISKTNEVIVNWYYQKVDTDMQASGDRFSKLIAIKFNLIEL
ncbi:MAG: DUF1987 domain-containing protein [Bacteroidota bacterium]